MKTITLIVNVQVDDHTAKAKRRKFAGAVKAALDGADFGRAEVGLITVTHTPYASEMRAACGATDTDD